MMRPYPVSIDENVEFLRDAVYAVTHLVLYPERLRHLSATPQLAAAGVRLFEGERSRRL